MKIINYKRGMNSFFDCVIHGRIIISPEEHESIVTLIKKMKKGVDYEQYYPYIPSLALEDIKRGVDHSLLASFKRPITYNIRVTATGYIVSKMPHVGTLRRGNYYFEIASA